MAESESESSDDDQEWTKQIKKEHKTIQAEKRMEQRMVREVKQAEKLSRISRVEHKFSELSQEEDQKKKKRSKLSLEERLTTETENTGILQTTETGHTYTFNLDKPK